jgi:hypothetical protein
MQNADWGEDGTPDCELKGLTRPSPGAARGHYLPQEKALRAATVSPRRRRSSRITRLEGAGNRSGKGEPGSAMGGCRQQEQRAEAAQTFLSAGFGDFQSPIYTGREGHGTGKFREPAG